MPHDFVWFECNTSDPDKAREFYKGLFGWEYEETPMPGGAYTTIKVEAGGEPRAGLMKNPAPGVPSHWLLYIGTEDIDDTVAKTQELGGRVIVPRTEIPGMGWFAVIQDPTDAVFAVWQKQ